MNQGNPKYPDIEKYIGEFGVILDYYRMGFKAENLPSDQHVYEIRLDSSENTVAIPEEELRPLIV